MALWLPGALDQLLFSFVNCQKGYCLFKRLPNLREYLMSFKIADLNQFPLFICTIFFPLLVLWNFDFCFLAAFNLRNADKQRFNQHRYGFLFRWLFVIPDSSGVASHSLLSKKLFGHPENSIFRPVFAASHKTLYFSFLLQLMLFPHIWKGTNPS